MAHVELKEEFCLYDCNGIPVFPDDSDNESLLVFDSADTKAAFYQWFNSVGSDLFMNNLNSRGNTGQL